MQYKDRDSSANSTSGYSTCCNFRSIYKKGKPLYDTYQSLLEQVASNESIEYLLMISLVHMLLILSLRNIGRPGVT